MLEFTAPTKDGVEVWLKRADNFWAIELDNMTFWTVKAAWVLAGL